MEDKLGKNWRNICQSRPCAHGLTSASW